MLRFLKTCIIFSVFYTIFTVIAINVVNADEMNKPVNIVEDDQLDINTHLKWARSLTDQNQKMVIANFKEKLNHPDYAALRDKIKVRPALQVFISSSMPRALLRSYAKEAKKYNATLVLRGLPSNSMRKLADFILDISDDATAAIQIDDEAYVAFGVKNVPTIILSTPAQIFDGVFDENDKVKFDKVSGSVTIKAALELFATSGALYKDAKELLK